MTATAAPADAAPFVRPDVVAFLAYLNSAPGTPIHQLPVDQARRMSSAMGPLAELETGPIARLEDLEMPGPAGPIRLRLFDARSEREPGPAMVFFHGGGWVLGDLDSYQPLCAELARALDMPVVSVDYRLAPEYPWPAAHEDCEAAVRWVADAPQALGFAPTGLVLAGDSAGGSLTITTALALRDRPAALPLLAQWAIYPATDMTTHYPSFGQFREGHLLTADAMRWFQDHYQADPADWRASPLHADLAGLPPALVTTASLDPIRDQGRAYAAALARAGVPVTFREAVGTIHGFLTLRRALPSGQADLARNLAALKGLIAETETRA